MKISEPVKKALMEGLRILAIAVVAGVILVGGAYVAEADLSPEWVSVWGVVVLLLKAIDKYLHELGKEKESDSLVRGLTRF